MALLLGAMGIFALVAARTGGAPADGTLFDPPYENGPTESLTVAPLLRRRLGEVAVAARRPAQ